ncbi:RNA recognition motif-containing protein [Toxoplasma gondii RUB]|uniref:RNA recognition motif-containing protein n=2 Tax=Toxoplasma gondii TaxID=5811 RepID=A0A086M168_TOXGO|nr:RNA recognition motif-containing protein [Toxoplasma gondii RUB]KFH08862.1 RNA recognition motif-containing protein [Toxoplasma gondii VAND]
MANVSRILLCGDVRGSFHLLGKLLKRIQDRQGPFAAVFCCGSFFGPPDKEASSTLSAGNVKATDADDGCAASPINIEHEDVAEEHGPLLSLLRERYSDQMKELSSVASSLPLPLFFIDEDVACAMAQVAARNAPATTCQAGECRMEKERTERGNGVMKDLDDASRDGVDGICGIVKTESDSPTGSYNFTDTVAMSATLSSDASGASGLVQLFPNIFWLGAAGFVRIAGLRVAFFGMPETETSSDEEVKQEGGDNLETRKTGRGNGANDPSVSDSSPSVKRRRLDEEKVEGLGEPPSVLTSGDPCQSHPSSSASCGCPHLCPPYPSYSFSSSAKALKYMADLGERPMWRARIDLMLSCRWPKGIWRDLSTLAEQKKKKEDEFNELLAKAHVSVDALDTRHSGSAASQLAGCLEPRYLFAASAGLFYARPAFRGARFGYTTKFIALGNLGSKEPERKPIHALQLTPLDEIRSALSPALARADALSDSEKKETSVHSSSLTADEAVATLFALPPDATCNPISSLLPSTLKLCGESSDSDALERMTPASLRRELLRNAQCLDDDSKSLSGAASPAQPSACRPFGPKKDPLQRGQGPQRPCCVVCVCNLPYGVDDQSLEKVMAAFGEVKFIYSPRNPEDKSQGTGKAFVVYFNSESAEKAVEASGRLEAGRRVLRVAMWREKIPFAHKVPREDGVPPPPKPGSSIVTKPHADCWFCLANPKVEKHLVASVGDTCYVAAPKGGMHVLHALIIPITHFPSVAFATEDVRAEIGRYVHRYRTALRQKENLDCIVYERYVPMRATKAMHTQVQCIPCSRAEGLRAVEVFKKKAHKVGLSFEALLSERNTLAFSELAARAPDTEIAYFYIELPGLSTASGQLVERFLYVQQSFRKGGASTGSGSKTGGGGCGDRLPMNFGREFIAELIERPELADWQNCIVDPEEERTRTAELSRLIAGALD